MGWTDRREQEVIIVVNRNNRIREWYFIIRAI
jgi:hypothetical protein